MNPFIHSLSRMHISHGNMSQRVNNTGRHVLERDERGEPTSESHDFIYSQRERREYREKIASPLREKEEILKYAILNSATPQPTESEKNESTDTETFSTDSVYGNPKGNLKKRNELSEEESGKTPTVKSLIKADKSSLLAEEKGEKSTKKPLNNNTCEISDRAPQEQSKNSVMEFIGGNFKLSTANKNVCLLPIYESRNQLKVILVGYVKRFPKNWIGLSFEFFDNKELKYGLLQPQSGCSGVFATVQAFLMKSLISNGWFKPAEDSPTPKRPTNDQVRNALVQSIADILWQAGGNHSALALVDKEYKEGKSEVDDRLDAITWNYYTSREDLQETISNSLDHYTTPANNGCLLLVLSAILSRGIQRVQKDMKYSYRPLVDVNGFCSTELVNLLLTGQAVQNIFENDEVYTSRADVGYLSPNEQRYSCQVGPRLKTPRYPVWVVNTERNNYTVLYSCHKELVFNWRAERNFTLYHYDPGNKNPEEKLTIDTISTYVKDPFKDVNTPALDECIRAKWKDAVIIR